MWRFRFSWRLAFAQADVIVGKAKSIDHGTKTVTLEDGSAYKLGNNAEHRGILSGYLAGDAVKIVTEGDTKHVITMGPDLSHAVSGKVKSVDVAAQSVTLENGVIYKFTSADKAALDGYRVGDRVKIMAHQVGTTHWGETISPAN